MKYVSLKFPGLLQLSKFHMDFAMANINMNFRNFTLTGKMTNEQIVCACTKYDAELDVLACDEKDDVYF